MPINCDGAGQGEDNGVAIGAVVAHPVGGRGAADCAAVVEEVAGRVVGAVVVLRRRHGRLTTAHCK